MALLLGRRRRPRLLVPRARCALEGAAVRPPSGWAAAARAGWSACSARHCFTCVLGALSAGLLVLVFLTALIGEPSSAQNLAPTFIYIVFWLGLVPLQVLLGNVWSRAQPVARDRERCRVALAAAGLGLDAAARLPAAARRLARRGRSRLVRGARAHLRRACEPARARVGGCPLQLRDVVRHGRVRPARWDEHGNGFTVYFGLLARIAPFGEHDGRLVLRAAVHRARGRRTDARDARLRGRDARVGRVRRAQPGAVLAEPERRPRRADTSSTRRGRPSCSRPGWPLRASSAASSSSRSPISRRRRSRSG